MGSRGNSRALFDLSRSSLNNSGSSRHPKTAGRGYDGAIATIAHLTSDSAEIDGVYEVKAVNPDGTIVLAGVDLTAEGIARRHGLEPVSSEEFEELFADVPTGPA